MHLSVKTIIWIPLYLMLRFGGWCTTLVPRGQQRNLRKKLDRVALFVCERFAVPMVASFAHDNLKYRLYINPARDVIGRESAIYGIHARYRVQASAHFIKPGATVLDVGANAGALTVPLALLAGRSGRVIAYEPNPHAYELLEKNVGLNSLPQVTIRQYALGEADGTLTFYATGNDTARGSLKQLTSSDRGQSVPVFAYDTHDEGVPVSFVKIDVEGSELSVLKGMACMLERLHPVLLCRVISRLYYLGGEGTEKRKGILEFFRSRGYALSALEDERGVQPLDETAFLEGKMRSFDIIAVFESERPQ